MFEFFAVIAFDNSPVRAHECTLISGLHGSGRVPLAEGWNAIRQSGGRAPSYLFEFRDEMFQSFEVGDGGH